MKNGVNETNFEIIREGLSYKEELEFVAKRFNMTQEETLKTIIHETYMSGVNFLGFTEALVIIDNYEECDADCDNCKYRSGDNCYMGAPIEDDFEEFYDEPPF